MLAESASGRNHRPFPIPDLITQIYQGSLEPRPWQTFLRLIRRMTGSDVAAIIIAAESFVTDRVAVFEFCTNVPSQQIEWLQKQLEFVDLIPNFSSAAEIDFSPQISDGIDCFSEEFFGYNNAAISFSKNGVSVSAGLFRSGYRTFRENEADLLLILQPHLEEAIAKYLTVAAGFSRSEA